MKQGREGWRREGECQSQRESRMGGNVLVLPVTN
jgi:hypothetical protein